MPAVIKIKLRGYVTEQAADEIVAELEQRDDVAEVTMRWKEPGAGAGVSR